MTTEYTSFDILGRVKGHKQTTDGVGYETEYAYNLSGAMVEQRYPSGRVVKNVLDASGDLSMVQSARCMDAAAGADADCTAQAGLWNYAKNFTYNPAGAVTSMQLGNGRWESTAFNSRLQPTQIGLGVTPNATNILKLDYSYGTTANNGNVLSQTITVPSVTIGGTTHNGFTAVQNYAYDSLNRLDDAAEYIDGNPNPSWRQDFTFDRYGNRSFVEGNTTFEGFEKLCANNTELCAELRKVLNPSANASDNRLSSSDGYVFDPAGNTIRDPQSRRFTYDGENKQVLVSDQWSVVSGQYVFDGDGKRVKKHVPSTGEVTVFVYDAGGKLIGEYSTVAAPQSPRVSFTTADHLGSPRILTDENGTTISRRDFMPFGEEIARTAYGSDTVRQKFTTYERDGETDLDYAQARMHSFNLGRFSSPDPLLSSGTLQAPQSWNRYAYVLGNPLVLTDPSGLFVWSSALGGSATTDELNEELETLRGSRKGASKEEKRQLNRRINQIKQIISRRKSVLQALQTARHAAGNLSGSDRDAVLNSINAYGEEHENNGVVIGVGDSNQTGQGLAGIENGRVVIAIRPDQFSSETLFMTLAHEGSHVIDAQFEISRESSFRPLHYPLSGSEFRSGISGRHTELAAYKVSFLVLLGANFDDSVGIGGVIFYRKGWKAVDQAVLDSALGRIYRGPNDSVGRLPANWNIQGRWR